MIEPLAMIPNLVGLAGMILVSHSSDRMLERRYHVAIPAVTGGVCSLTAWHNSFSLLFPDTLVVSRSWRLQLFRSLLVAAERVPDGILSGLRHCID
jgi:hypothetical protein